MKTSIYTTITAVALCVACSHKESSSNSEILPAPVSTTKPAEDQGPMAAQATLKPAKKQKAKGLVHFSQSGDKIKVEGTLEGLKPGPHGFHIHETGDCTLPDFKSAGGHFNPTHKNHGAPDSMEKHEGDMGNIVADAKGKVKLNMEVSGMSLGGAASIVGKAVVIHATADDMKSQPAGNSGDRIACGVIEALK